MRLTNRCEYGLLALIYLARQAPDKMIHGEEIAQAQNIPKRFLQQILHNLKRAKLIRSGKGKLGGYGLARPPEEITLAEVIRLFEGPLAPTRSVSRNFYEKTPIAKEDRIIGVFQEIRDMIAEKLEKTTLKEIV
jgi:Rrf2 family transcriptional regulator, cysteine metabolism repressor